MTEQVYKDKNGEWRMSEWKNGKIYRAGEDGHTYTHYTDGKVEHIECWCFNET